MTYESQLTADELLNLHTALSEPAANIGKIQAAAPPWREGEYAGSRPSLKTLYKISARLRSECNEAEAETTDQLLTEAQLKLLTQPAYSAGSSTAINQIFSLICHEILRKTLYRDDSKNRIFLLRLLLRHQQLLLQKARFQRLAIEQFDKWYMNGPAKEILEKLDVASYADRIDQLGRAIFGEDWTPQVARTDGIPGLDQLPPLPLEPQPDPVPAQPATEAPTPSVEPTTDQPTEPSTNRPDPEAEPPSVSVEPETEAHCNPDEPPTDQPTDPSTINNQQSTINHQLSPIPTNNQSPSKREKHSTLNTRLSTFTMSFTGFLPAFYRWKLFAMSNFQTFTGFEGYFFVTLPNPIHIPCENF